MSLKHTSPNTIFGYDPNKFMPIRYNGQLQNKSEFVRYKLNSIIHRHSLMSLALS